MGFIIFSFFQTIPFQILHRSIKQLTGFRDIKDMEDSDELFDYIADLPSDNVLEICNFVLIGGGGGAGEGVERRDEAGEVQDSLGSEESSVEHYNNFVEILDFQGGNTNNNNNVNNNNNNNNNEKVIENTLNEGQLKVISLTT